MKISAEKSLVIAIDYQERLLPAMNNKEEVLENTIKLLKGMKSLEVPTIVTQQYTKGLLMTVNEIKEEVKEPFEYYDKTTFSCVANEEILKKIEELDKKIVILCGMEAHICVIQTAMDLRKFGYIPVLVTDCIASRKENDKLYAIERAKQEGVILTTYEAILFEMAEKAGTTAFKEISKIIK